MRNEADGLFAALDESIATVRAAGPGARLQVSHLKCASQAVWGRAGEAVAGSAARDEGLDVAADQYPYTAAATTLATILPPGLQGLGVDACVAALSDPHVRDLVRAEIARGISGWENVAADPGWAGIRISYAASRPDWAGRSLAELAEELHADPADLAFDALVDDRLDVSVVIDCMSEPDVEAIMAVPWIAVCTDAEGRRPGHPILDAGRPHPRTYGSAPARAGDLRARAGRCRSSWRSRSSRRSRPPASACATAASCGREPSPTSWSSTRRRSPTRRRTWSRRATRRGSSTSSSTGARRSLAGTEVGERPGRLLRRS